MFTFIVSWSANGLNLLIHFQTNCMRVVVFLDIHGHPGRTSQAKQRPVDFSASQGYNPPAGDLRKAEP